MKNKGVINMIKSKKKLIVLTSSIKTSELNRLLSLGFIVVMK